MLQLETPGISQEEFRLLKKTAEKTDRAANNYNAEKQKFFKGCEMAVGMRRKS